MINKSNKKVNHDSEMFGSSTGWDAAIQYAKQELSNAKFRVVQLKAALKMLNENKDLGEPWPSWAEKKIPKTQ
jgi:hypothetical protein